MPNIIGVNASSLQNICGKKRKESAKVHSTRHMTTSYKGVFALLHPHQKSVAYWLHSGSCLWGVVLESGAEPECASMLHVLESEQFFALGAVVQLGWKSLGELSFNCGTFIVSLEILYCALVAEILRGTLHSMKEASVYSALQCWHNYSFSLNFLHHYCCCNTSALSVSGQSGCRLVWLDGTSVAFIGDTKGDIAVVTGVADRGFCRLWAIRSSWKKR